jgi:hypothetical protein
MAKKSKYNYRVRFNLGRGENYMKWKVINLNTKESFYLDPNSFVLQLKDCKLHNRRKVAEKIYGGSNKDVCAWVNCVDFSFKESIDFDKTNILNKENKVYYNPKINPFWVYKNKDVDNFEFENLVTFNNAVYSLS